MLAFDGSATTPKRVEMIAASPLFRRIPCHLVMVGTKSDAAQEQLANAQKTLMSAGFTAPTRLIPGEPENLLIDYQSEEKIDLLIMGAYGHSRIRQLIVGNTTTAMIRKIRISLMILR